MKSGVLKDVFFYYTCIKRPVPKYDSTDKEWKVTVCADKATATKFQTEYPKKRFKLVPNDEFIERYKADVPFPDQPIQYVTSFSRNEINKDGSAVAEEHRPKIGLEDRSGKYYDITKHDTLEVGNGSFGDLYFFVIDNPSFGEFPKLSSIIVKKLVEYTGQSKTQGNPIFEAQELQGDIDDLDIDVVKVADDEESRAKAPRKETSKASNQPPVDDDLPF